MITSKYELESLMPRRASFPAGSEVYLRITRHKNGNTKITFRMPKPKNEYYGYGFLGGKKGMYLIPLDKSCIEAYKVSVCREDAEHNKSYHYISLRASDEVLRSLPPFEKTLLVLGFYDDEEDIYVFRFPQPEKKEEEEKKEVKDEKAKATALPKESRRAN